MSDISAASRFGAQGDQPAVAPRDGARVRNEPIFLRVLHHAPPRSERNASKVGVAPRDTPSLRNEPISEGRNPSLLSRCETNPTGQRGLSGRGDDRAGEDVTVNRDEPVDVVRPAIEAGAGEAGGASGLPDGRRVSGLVEKGERGFGP